MLQELYQEAMKYAFGQHSEQKLWKKVNYLLHISSVAMEVIVAHKYDD